MIHKRNELLFEVLKKNLSLRHMDAYYCKNAEEAVRKVLSLMPKGSSVGWGGSMTLRDTGILSTLRSSGDYKLLDRDNAPDAQQKRQVEREIFFADFVLTSCNAMSQKGEIVNIDGNGNRMAAITFGPRQVIFVVGMNKVTATLDDALSRARNLAAPVNGQRFPTDTPCHKDGQCHDCLFETSICSYIQVLRNSRPAGRHTVVFVDGDFGY